MNITGPRFATHVGLLQNITVSVRCHLCGSLTVKTKKKKKKKNLVPSLDCKGLSLEE